MEKVKPDLVIVYDKYTERAANGVSGKLAGNYICNVQKLTVFESKKNEYTNNNRILFLTERSLMWPYLCMGKMTKYVIDADYIDGDLIEGGKYKVFAYLHSLGNWRGIEVDIEKTINALPKKEIRAYKSFKYFHDYLLYPFSRRRVSMDFEGFFYESAVEFFLKKENIKLIIPD